MAAPPSPGPSVRPDPAEAVARIALQVGATPMAHVDVAAMLSGVCAALPGAVGVEAAVLVLTDPADPRDPAARHVFASDEAAARLGLIQHRAGRGPVPAAVRGDRPLVVPDLTVGGPPELAAAAADCGLVRSLVVPVPGSGPPVGGLQLLAGPGTTPAEATAVLLRPLLAALSARLADVREIARLQLAAGSGAGHPAVAGTNGTAVSATAGDGDGPVDGAAAVTGRHGPVTGGADPSAAGPQTWVDPAAGDLGTDPDLSPTSGPDADAPVTHGPAEDGTGTDHSGTDGTGGYPPVAATNGSDGPVTATGGGETARFDAVAGRPARGPVGDLFAAGEPEPDTPPIGQALLGWEGPEPTPRPTPLPIRALPARVRVIGRSPRPAPAAVPEQRSGPMHATRPAASSAVAAPATVAIPAIADDAAGITTAGDDTTDDEPTRRVPRHRLRDDA